MIDDGPYLFEPICHDDHLHLFYKVRVIISEGKNGQIMLIPGEINKAITSDFTGGGLFIHCLANIGTQTFSCLFNAISA